MKKLYHSYLTSFFSVNLPDVEAWKQLYNLIPLNSPLVDRCQHVKMPFQCEYFTDNMSCLMPKEIPSTTLTYEACSEKRVNELLEISKKIDKPITILYSGGIDSTFIVVSFLKYMKKQDLNDRVRIALTKDSIQENPDFYYNYIRPNLHLISSEPIDRFYDKSTIIVSGQHNDQLMGTDQLWVAFRKGHWGEIFSPYSRDFYVNKYFLILSKDVEAANLWFDILDDQIKSVSPVEIKTNYDFFWWYNFSYKWQSSYFTPLMSVGVTNKKHLIDQDFFNNYYIHFFSSQDFQLWAMTNPDLKTVDGDWKKYKWECRRLIYEYNKDEDYLYNKTKAGSLKTLLSQKKFSIALTTDFEFIDIEDPIDYYLPKNSFSRR